jgi:isopenicillin N synthase-like dioxygenase
MGDPKTTMTHRISISHRVVPPPAATPRYSIPTFWGCDHEVPLIPIPTCVSNEHPSKYDIVTAGAYVKSRMDATYSVGPREVASNES